MKTIRFLLGGMMMGLLLNGCGARNGAGDALVKSCQDWLALLDTGRYGESWDQATTSFREAVTRPDWEAFMQGERGKLGHVTKRTRVTGKLDATAARDAREGEFTVVEFTTDFEQKSEARETVMAIPQPDGTWKVSAYYLE